MLQSPSTVRRSIARLGAVLALTAATLFLAVPHRAAAFVCQNNFSYTRTYFDGPAHTTRVGQCFFPCNDKPAVCTGTVTAYFNQFQDACCGS